MTCIIWAYEVASNQNMKKLTSDSFVIIYNHKMHTTKMLDVISRKITYENHKNIFHIFRYFLIMTNLFMRDQINKIVLLSRLVISIS